MPITRPVALALASLLLFAACSSESPAPAPDVVQPAIVTDTVPHDSDDPAVWIHPGDPALSLIIGTDKDSLGGLYVFGLDGRLLADRSVTGLQRPNNVDVEYGLVLGGDTVDVAVTTERYANQLRVFRLPDMTAIDGGGIPVFAGDSLRAPMGVALYRRPADGAIFAVVSRKTGPSGSYLWQYQLMDGGNGAVTGEKVREFGMFSGGDGEIEAIAVDDALGYVYYSDEALGVRKYHADPDHADAGVELAVFGTDGFAEDREGISIFTATDSTGWLLVSDQQAARFQVFPREGTPGDPHNHPMLQAVRVAARESDGSETVSVPLSERFPAGLFVAMSEGRVFHLYDWRDLGIPAR